MEKYFDIRMPFWRFALNTSAFSCLGLLPILLLYIVLTPGFGAMLLGSGQAFSRLLRQVLTNGLVVVFCVNYMSFFLYALSASKHAKGAALSRVLLIDPPARVTLFILLHAVIYVLSADWFGSFGGDRLQALRVVGPTLARSVFFENISGVYLYATLVSALPLYTSVIDRGLETCDRCPDWFRNLRSKLPGKLGPILLALALFGAVTLTITAASALITRLQSTWV
ncbi:hypothetical protein [Actibacterium pelagium]|uniref:Uncharacterized protein n=1 Tax=Actibacterium pelagium TaxID=2029103 RepID=A0A917AN83_9RHOB|nr:hypothetical protein [Actibacterium pelagium]GGE62747.1 hypothetical protein GCM10011517_33090 [Actibacterium pelagium]